MDSSHRRAAHKEDRPEVVLTENQLSFLIIISSINPIISEIKLLLEMLSIVLYLVEPIMNILMCLIIISWDRLGDRCAINYLIIRISWKIITINFHLNQRYRCSWLHVCRPGHVQFEGNKNKVALITTSKFNQ